MSSNSAYVKLVQLLGMTKASDALIEASSFKHALLPILFVDVKYPEGITRFAFHEQYLKDIKNRIAVNNTDFFQELVDDPNFKSKTYRGYSVYHTYARKANVVWGRVDFNEGYVHDPLSHDLTDGDFDRVNNQLTNYAKKQGVLLKEIGGLLADWHLKTKAVKDHDLYYSFSERDHKISFCLNKAVPILDNGRIS